MSLVCLECNTIYRDNMKSMISRKERRYGISCLKANCYGMVEEIDELFVPIIIELNRKGYKTKYCCNGHYHKTGTMDIPYIAFEKDVKLPSLPKNYKHGSKLDNGEIAIEYDYDENKYFHKFYENDVQFHRDIILSSLDVLDWVNNLPDLNATVL